MQQPPGTSGAAATPAARAHLPAPRVIVGAAVALGAAVAAGVLAAALSQPWLGLELDYDVGRDAAIVVRSEGPSAGIPVGTALTHASAHGDVLRLVAKDFVVEPDGSLGTYADYEVFLERQGRLARMQRSGDLVLTDGAGRAFRIEVAPARPFWSLRRTSGCSSRSACSRG